MGGRGSSGGGGGGNLRALSDKSIDLKLKTASEEMQRYAQSATPMNFNAVGAEKFYAAQRQFNALRNEKNRRLDEAAKIRHETERPFRTFVNSFGEATTREITTLTYKRAQRRMERDVLRNLGVEPTRSEPTRRRRRK